MLITKSAHAVERDRARRGPHLVAAGLVMFAAVVSLRAAAPRPIDFSRDIRPIFSENCFACHGPDEKKRKAGLRFDVKADAFKKLDSGSIAIVPGQPAQSALLKVISLPADDDDHMPPAKTGKQLTNGQVDLLRRWVEQGAKWAEHWAYTVPERPEVPAFLRKKADGGIL